MEEHDHSSWLGDLFNMEIFKHSDNERVDTAIKKDHDCILYLLKLGRQKSSDKDKRKWYLNEAVKQSI